MNKYNIPDQIEGWEDLNTRFTQDEIAAMCNTYLKSRIRAGKTRETQKQDLAEFRAFKKAQSN